MKSSEHGVSGLILSQSVDTEVPQLAGKKECWRSGQNGPLHESPGASETPGKQRGVVETHRKTNTEAGGVEKSRLACESATSRSAFFAFLEIELDCKVAEGVVEAHQTYSSVELGDLFHFNNS